MTSHRTGRKSLFTMTCEVTGESQVVIVCQGCSEDMPAVDGDSVRVDEADDDINCEFCGN